MTKNLLLKKAINYLLMQAGAFLAAFALEEFLVPNNLIDGGVVGISIITSYVAQIPLGALIILLNLPFIVFGYRKMGRDFVVSTVYSVLSLSVWVTVLKPVPEVTNDFFLASVFGGVILGAGVGTILRFGGSLDGTEIVALTLTKRLGYSVGEIVMFLNVFILATAGFVFGWDRAMYSLVTYFIAYKIIDIIVEGFDNSKALYIISSQYEEIRRRIIGEMNHSVTVFNGSGGFSREECEILYVVISRAELYRLKQLVFQIDENAFISITDIHEVISSSKIKKMNEFS